MFSFNPISNMLKQLLALLLAEQLGIRKVHIPKKKIPGEGLTSKMAWSRDSNNEFLSIAHFFIP